MALFGSSSLPPIDPFVGPKPVVGDTVYIDFGDSITAHPEVTGTCTAITDEHITVDGQQFRLDSCMAIDVDA